MIIIIACSETEGDDVNKLSTPSENARKHLINYISHGDIKMTSEEFNDSSYKGINCGEFFNNVDLDNINEDALPMIQNWISKIKNNALKKLEVMGDRLNALKKPLLRKCSEFPLWSAVMVPHFKSPNLTATSARVEGYFSTLKSSILTKKMSRMCVDKFLVTHIKSIRGDLKIAVSHNNKDSQSNQININVDESITSTEIHIEEKPSNTDKTVHEDIIIDEKSLSDVSDENQANSQDFLDDNNSSSDSATNNEEIEIENWKNKAYLPSPPPKKIKRSKYLNSHPEIKIKQKINQKIVKHRLDIVKNGNLVGPLSIGSNKNKKNCKVINTCAFDSILPAVATAYLDSQNYTEFIDTINCSILNIAS
ncbi:unnamed protein product [Macrosiphum euphorbiae]|uniref:Uncharacterized protein n=1 Tax=Macrosiphum euphorbiae TaxID=13131 RepID=A0AAV0X6H3_9HEMI|nr:unnamed protein product [Macrosiphum euphorbiae]